MSADRNLLFGILAVQSGFCTGARLIEAMSAWTLAKERPLGDILLERGFLQQDEHDLIAALVAKQLAKHGGDVEKSLAALTPTPRFAAELRLLADEDVQRSLAAFSDGDAERTRTFGTGRSGEPVRYRILRPYARGGLGEVFVARDEELGREVALKEIQSQHADDLDSRERFVREAEVTGALEHPGVVAVYGLGSYADGRPFYAMRFIQGDSLKEAIERFHAKGKRDFFGTEFRQLLGRFIDVCQAIAYAHSRGVLHRDLKPGNIMLGKFGETLVVDWGLAKVAGKAEGSSGGRPISASSSSHSTPTIQGQAIGTPAYMSPEQATGKLDELGPATDVYSLGATLYALLADRAPIDADGVVDALRKAERGEWTPLRKVNPAIPAPLAAICAKAMALKPSDRYASAQALGADVERFLADEPVAVHRDPFIVRAGRWARKHRTAVATSVAALVVGAVSMGIGLAVVGDRNAKLADANAKLDEARRGSDAAKEQALKRLAQVEKSNDVLTAVFDDLDVRKVKEGPEPLEAVLARRLVKAGEQLEGDAVGDVLVVANLQNQLGVSLANLGFAVEATRLLEKAKTTRTSKLGADHPETLTSANNLAGALQAAGGVARALILFEQTLKLRRTKLGPDHPDTLGSLNDLAAGLRVAGELGRALPLHEEAYKLRRATLGPDHPDTLTSMNNLASGLRESGDVGRALALFEEALQRMRANLGPEHPDTLSCMNNLAVCLKAAGKLEQALPLYQETLDLTENKLGPDHPNTLNSMNNLATAYRAARKFDQALPLFEESFKRTQAKLGPNHPETLLSMNNLASGLHDAGQDARALTLFAETVKLMRATLGPDHHDTLMGMNNLAATYWATGDQARALSLREETLKLMKSKLGADHLETLQMTTNLAGWLRVAGKLDQALPLYEETLRIRRAKLGPGHPLTVRSMSNLAAAYLSAKRSEQALRLWQEAAERIETRGIRDHNDAAAIDRFAAALETMGRWPAAERWRRQLADFVKKHAGAGSLAYAGELVNLGDNLLQQMKFAEAEAVIRDGLSIREKSQPDAWTTHDTRSILGAALMRQQKYATAEPLLVAGFEGMKARVKAIPIPLRNQRLGEALDRLTDFYTATHKPDEVKKWQAERAKYAAPKVAEPAKQTEKKSAEKKTLPGGKKETTPPSK